VLKNRIDWLLALLEKFYYYTFALLIIGLIVVFLVEQFLLRQK